jgi:hypothetical protein
MVVLPFARKGSIWRKQGPVSQEANLLVVKLLKRIQYADRQGRSEQQDHCMTLAYLIVDHQAVIVDGIAPLFINDRLGISETRSTDVDYSLLFGFELSRSRNVILLLLCNVGVALKPLADGVKAWTIYDQKEDPRPHGNGSCKPAGSTGCQGQEAPVKPQLAISKRQRGVACSNFKSFLVIDEPRSQTDGIPYRSLLLLDTLSNRRFSSRYMTHHTQHF